MTRQGEWKNKYSFLFAMIGVAVGLGNIWRFSYIVYSNGGGSFFIPYLISIFILAIPFLILEYGLGFKFKKPFPEILKSINPKFEIIAWILVVLLFIVLIYYMIIMAWDMVYVYSSFTFSWGSDTMAYFVNSVGGSSNLANANYIVIPTAIGTLASWVILWIISNQKVDKGIGTASKILIPILFILMAIIIVYALTLPGAGFGLHTLLNPSWEKLFSIKIWLSAFSQIIFSLAVGEALALTYASYLPENSKLIDNTLVVVAINSIFEICTAFGVFSILGYMSYSTGTPIVELISEGTGLIFVVFPLCLNIMGTMGHILAPLFFIAVYFAGITSSISLLEPILNAMSTKLNLSRAKTAKILCIIGCIFSLMMTTGINSYLVSIMDSFINIFGILPLLPIQGIIFGWIYNLDEVEAVLNSHSSIHVGKTWRFLVRYVPAVLISIMWIYGVYDLFSTPKNSLELIIYGVISVATLVISFYFTRVKSPADSIT